MSRYRKFRDWRTSCGSSMIRSNLPPYLTGKFLSAWRKTCRLSGTRDRRTCELKQRITRILIREIVADVDDKSREIVLLIHWAGGRHSELRLKKIETGKHRHCTNVDAIEVIRKMAGKFSDEQIAATLNRLRLRTGADNPWNENRVYSVRHHHSLPSFDPTQCSSSELVTLEQAALRLGLSPPSVRKMIEASILPGYQVVECTP